MFKGLITVGLFSLVSSIQAHAYAGKTQQTADAKNPAYFASTVIDQKPTPASLKGETAEDKTENVRVVSVPKKDGFDYALLGINFALVFTGFVGIWVAVSTLRKIERQTMATETAATAASKSVDAYIATERPFVIIETRGDNGYEFWAVNYGKSPAQIIFSNPVPIVETPLLTELPQSLNYGAWFDEPSVQQINVQWIAPSKAHFLGSFEPDIMKFINDTETKELLTSQRVMIVYSAFKYRGIHSEQTYTCTYCYRKYPNGLKMWGREGWNKYT